LPTELRGEIIRLTYAVHVHLGRLVVTKSSKTVAIVAIGAAVLVIGVFVVRDFLLRRPGIAHCPDGSHPTIDLRDFTAQHWTYSMRLEASIADKAKVSAELDPKALEQISEALQEGREFRKYVVAGYNSCAITRAQYGQFGARFSALDALAREIDIVLSKPSLSREESRKLAGLICQYGDLAKQLGSQ